MRKPNSRVVALVGFLLTSVGCGPPGPKVARSAPLPGPSAVVLKVVLFPYVPDSVGDGYQALIASLESGFESTQPGIDLQIVIDPNMNLYDYAPGGTLSRLLGSGADAAQVVEVDTILMGNLTASGWVQPVGLENPGVFATAWQAASVGDVAYGVPTYLCTNVIYAGSDAIATAQNGTNLVGILTGLKPKTPPLVGDYSGSWTLPSVYVDAWTDTNGTAGIASSYAPPVDQKTMMYFAPVVNVCATSTSANPCLDGTYSDNTKAETAFANGSANGFIGYTERLFYIRQANPGMALPSVISAPIGGGSNPTMFVDSLVFNPNCTGTCLQGAQSFATYMSSTSVRSLIAFSQDGPQGTLPRYLLQANEDFYSSAPASGDPMYQAYTPIVSRAQPYPNAGFPDARKTLGAAVTAALGNSSPPP